MEERERVSEAKLAEREREGEAELAILPLSSSVSQSVAKRENPRTTTLCPRFTTANDKKVHTVSTLFCAVLSTFITVVLLPGG